MTKQEVLARALRLAVKMAENSAVDLQMAGLEAFEAECVEARSIVAAAAILLVSDEEGPSR